MLAGKSFLWMETEKHMAGPWQDLSGAEGQLLLWPSKRWINFDDLKSWKTASGMVVVNQKTQPGDENLESHNKQPP